MDKTEVKATNEEVKRIRDIRVKTDLIFRFRIFWILTGECVKEGSASAQLSVMET